MVRGFNVSNNQVNGSGDNLAEQSRPLLQVEDIRLATGGENALLESRDWGFFTVDVPNFWERPEMSGMLRDVTLKPDKYAWLETRPSALPAPSTADASRDNEPDSAISEILESLRRGGHSHPMPPHSVGGVDSQSSLP
jgi:type IV secretion system protein VirD4